MTIKSATPSGVVCDPAHLHDMLRRWEVTRATIPAPWPREAIELDVSMMEMSARLGAYFCRPEAQRAIAARWGSSKATVSRRLSHIGGTK
jgi:hypothetical protein